MANVELDVDPVADRRMRQRLKRKRNAIKRREEKKEKKSEAEGEPDSQKTKEDDLLRCRRKDGKTWRCKNLKLEGEPFCERHLGRKWKPKSERMKCLETKRNSNDADTNMNSNEVAVDGAKGSLSQETALTDHVKAEP